jgi:pantoate--beta-alanine ligase
MLITTVSSLRNRLSDLANQDKKIGFVPTMGALHEGHLSLIERAYKENDIVVVSIFVNPTQFNNLEDLQHYPRTLEKDMELLPKKFHSILLFYPDYNEIYPKEDPFIPIDLGNLDTILEGKHRPGHFKGVVHVVHNLFKIVRPNRAYFGQKDFQQVAVIRFMTKRYDFSIEIVACETKREQSGLAMSSRNMRLSAVEKDEALIIWETLNFVKQNKQNYQPDELKNRAVDFFNSGKLKLEYLEIVDAESLSEISNWNFEAVCCIAAYCGKVRLIDNLLF